MNTRLSLGLFGFALLVGGGCVLLVPRFTCGNGAVDPGEFCFDAPQAFTVGDNPRSLSPGDLDGDGDLDIAIANGGDSNVSLLINNGAGQFTPFDDRFAVGANPQSIEAVDVDGDDLADIITSDESAGTVSVLINQGNLTFAQRVVLDTGGVGFRPYTVTVADINGDGRKDVVVANVFDTAPFGRIALFFQELGGTFSAAQQIDAGATALKPRAVFLADFDGDGDLDIATANENSNNVSILDNDGAGTFTTVDEVEAGEGPFWVGAADLDNDGVVDLFVANKPTNQVTPLINDGTGEFTPADPIEIGQATEYIGLGDLDGDGVKDLVSANSGDGTVTALLVRGDREIAFQPIAPITIEGNPHWAEARDFNGDGVDDIMSVNGNDNELHITLSAP
jgi:hypothetical protein